MPESPVPLLLREQTHLQTSRARSYDFQTEVGHPGEDRCDPLPCVVVLTRSADREVDELSLRLAAQETPLLRIDSDRCLHRRVTWDAQSDVLTFESRRYRPRVTWLRYFTSSSIADAAAGGSGDAEDPLGADATNAYVRDQWRACASVLHRLPTAVPVNGRTHPWEKPGRIEQLVAAKRRGLEVPRTVVASCPADAARALPEADDLVVKSLGDHYIEATPGRLRGLFPTVVGRETMLGCTGVEPAPVLVQELVPSTRELRAYVVAGRAICFALRKHAPGELFTPSTRPHVTPMELPAQLERPLLGLVREWQIDVCAFDLLETEGGYVFLEANFECDWLWCERAAGVQSVSGAVSDLLVSCFAGHSDGGHATS